MLGLLTYSEISHLLLKVADPDVLAQHDFSTRGLRLALQARAQQLEPQLPLWDTEHTVLVSSDRVEADFRALFSSRLASAKNPAFEPIAQPFDSHERIFKLSQLRYAIDLLKELDPNLSEIFNVVISCIFTSNSDKSLGAVSLATPGVLWANVRNHWSTWDILEFLVHKLTHNIIFLDEFLQVHYTDHQALGRVETFAQSAFVNGSRPLDKVLHGILAGIAILNLRANAVFQQIGLSCPLNMTTNTHPASNILNEQIAASIASIEENKAAMKLLTNRGHELLTRAKKRSSEFASHLIFSESKNYSLRSS